MGGAVGVGDGGRRSRGRRRPGATSCQDRRYKEDTDEGQTGTHQITPP
jgi:hypothetical protein